MCIHVYIYIYVGPKNTSKCRGLLCGWNWEDIQGSFADIQGSFADLQGSSADIQGSFRKRPYTDIQVLSSAGTNVWNRTIGTPDHKVTEHLLLLVSECRTRQHTATQCNAMQHTATQCNTLQHTATQCNTLQNTATHCNKLQRTAIHCNTLQHTTTHCNKEELLVS